MSVAVASLVSGGVAVVLMTSGMRKLRDQHAFVRSLRERPVLKHLALPIAGLLPWVEMSLAAVLIFGSQRPSMWMASVAFVGFSIVTYTDSGADCGCGPLVFSDRSKRFATNLALSGVLAVGATALPATSLSQRILGATTTLIVILVVQGLLELRQLLHRRKSTEAWTPLANPIVTSTRPLGVHFRGESA